ncbi:hypothetical protein [Methylophilus sp. DW102]|uniref:hypothetical protein n=1 Tax=Methylophilus sp. DW102 TaxID=3095607 RepID=UPI003089B9B7|nr:hypothetical protein MTDW_02370 [Methylophilus sp. DW102]
MQQHQTIETSVDWNQLMRSQLSCSLAHHRAIGITQTEAAYQVMTAIHEAIHVFFEVLQGRKLVGGRVSTRPYQAGVSDCYGAIEAENGAHGKWLSMLGNVGTDYFEFCVNGFEVSPDCDNDMKTAYTIAKYLPCSEQPTPNGFLHPVAERFKGKVLDDAGVLLLLEEAAQIVSDAFKDIRWWSTIRTVALYMLKHRRMEDGFISYEHMQQIQAFVKEQEKTLNHGNTAELSDVPAFRDDVAWLMLSFNVWPERPLSIEKVVTAYKQARLSPDGIAELSKSDIKFVDVTL